MSLPLTRRIARAALLVGAAAAPLIGAGAASAAELPQVGDLGGLTNVDKAPELAGTVTNAAQDSGAVKAVQQTVPAAARTVAGLGKTAQPAVSGVATKAAGTIGGAAVEVGKRAGKTGLPLQSLPTTDQLPLKGLPLGG
ncbi:MULTISPECIES: ATP-binding protein [unclassified Streptomyces]|uniref:ATP-binding protein n=1 Tax=unclassified Streptomyces TaxID=2593676 RepID=UPI0033D3C097